MEVWKRNLPKFPLHVCIFIYCLRYPYLPLGSFSTLLFALRGYKEEVRKRLEKGREESEVKVFIPAGPSCQAACVPFLTEYLILEHMMGCSL